MDISILKKIGLNEKEIKIYIALLKNGASSVRALADLTELNRGTVYDILKRLIEINLVSYYHQETKQKFVAEDPEKLISILKDREQDLKTTKLKLEAFLPELKSLQDKGSNKPVTRFYEGKSGVKFILKDVLNSVSESDNKEYFIYSVEGVREDIYSAFPGFSKKRIKAGIKVNAISLSEGGDTYGLDERRWLKVDASQAPEMTYIIIYAGKCAFISRDALNKPVGVIIENKMIYQTQKIIFKQLWSTLK